MQWYIATSTRFDFEQITTEAALGQRPKHLLVEVAESFDAEFVQPAQTTNLMDRVMGYLYGNPQTWAAARRLAARLQPGDGVYATGDDIGFAVLFHCRLRAKKKLHSVLTCTDPGRLRTRLFGWLLVMVGMRWVMLVSTERLAASAYKSFGSRLEYISVLGTQVDTDFFSPAPVRSSNEPPLVASCGVETRDYDLLAQATDFRNIGLRFQVEVCFASPNISDKTRYSLPAVMPEYMRLNPLGFAELRDLYRRCDFVVVPLLDNNYSAGLTTVFEAIACRSPVVAAATPGLLAELAELDLIVPYKPGSLESLVEALKLCLDDPKANVERAAKAYEWFNARYSTEAYMARLSEAMLHRSKTYA